MKSFRKFLLKNAGIVLVGIGVLWLAIPFFAGLESNVSLLTGGVLVVAGFVVYIVINKFIQ
jgi:putative flippase GtrA